MPGKLHTIAARGLVCIALGSGCARVTATPGNSGTNDAAADNPRDDGGAAADRGGGSVDRVTPMDLPGAVDALVTSDVLPAGPADAACATQSAMAETLPLDLYVMMDSSGSMAEETATGPTKWDAVRTAMASFLNDTQSAGIGVGLQYFPLLREGVPASCTADGPCGTFGPCDRARTCYGPGTTQIVLCETNADCRQGETCTLLGSCPLFGGYCAPVGTTCLLGDPCTPLDGSCRGRNRCDVPAYAAPAVPIATLPGAAAGLIASLTMRRPAGGTPTGPALTGAIEHARARATAQADHKVAVLLVTDGVPAGCSPETIPEIAAIAAAGAAGTPPIPTFVIGVFTPEEAVAASTNLNLLAQQGGTGSAVVIETAQNVTQALQTALGRIRSTAVACEYRIPPATMGAIDFDKVNVQVTAGGGAVTTVGYVPARPSCDPTRGGWHYDVDPASGATPTAIIACDSTCAQLRGDAGARVDIVLGCQRMVVL